MTMNVQEYFENRFPNFRYRQSRDPGDLASVPISSICGSECCEVIRAGWLLLSHAENAHGAGQLGDAEREAIGQIVVNICGVFICG